VPEGWTVNRFLRRRRRSVFQRRTRCLRDSSRGSVMKENVPTGTSGAEMMPPTESPGH